MNPALYAPRPAPAPAPVPPAPWPTWGSGPIRASYCSHRDDVGEVVFDPVYFGVLWDRGDHARLEACLVVKRRLGLTDVVLAIAGSYGEYLDHGAFDWYATPETLHALAVWLLDGGFRPILFVSTADTGSAHEITDGTMARVCAALTDLVDHAWYCIGWEVDIDRGGAWTAGQASDALLVCRRTLGDRAQLVWHGQPERTTPASYYGSDPTTQPHATTPIRWVGPPDNGSWVDADDPSDGNEMGAFYCEGSGFAEIDVIAFQTAHGHDGPSFLSGDPGLDGFGQPRWWARTIECLDRFLPPGTPMPGAAGYQSHDAAGHVLTHAAVSGVGAPDWFASPRRRGRVRWVLLETVCYEYIRHACSDAAVVRCTAEAAALGCVDQGCQQ